MDKIKFNEINEEVIYINEPIARINTKEIALLKNQALHNTRKRIRICTHHDVGDSIHEMLIVHVRGAYIRPHKHFNKIESFHVIEGDLKVVIFDDKGVITDVIEMGSYHSGKNFYYRLADSSFHTVIPQSDIVVFHEITNGPFVREETVFAGWAPEETDSEQQKTFMDNLANQIDRYRN